MKTARVLVSILLVMLGLFITPTPPASASLPAATHVLGQFDANGAASFTKGTASSSGTTNASGLDDPGATAVDEVGNVLFVADTNNNRVLAFAIDGVTNEPAQTAFAVVGQPTMAASASGLSATALNKPTGVSVDQTRRRLFVADSSNNRVLVFDITTLVSGLAATTVIGQTTFTTSASSATQSTFNKPVGVFYDSLHDRLFVADSFNHRALWFNAAALANGMAASGRLGQTSYTASGFSSASTRLHEPYGFAYDTGGDRLFIADRSNCRVMMYPAAALSSGMAATAVFGQASLSSGSCSITVSATTLLFPTSAAYDSMANRLYISDDVRGRINVYNGAAIAATSNASILTIGQPSATTQLSGLGQQYVSYPGGLSISPSRSRLFSADPFSHRTMHFALPITANFPLASGSLGHSVSGVPSYLSNTANNGMLSASTISGGTFSVTDTTNHRIFVSDTEANRVLVFQADTRNKPLDAVADWVIGQTSFSTAVGGASATIMSQPTSLALDQAGLRLFVRDNYNLRVLVFDVSNLSTGMAASAVIGQVDFDTAAQSSVSASTIEYNGGLAYDAVRNRLYVTDSGRSRVLVFNATVITNGMNASFVFGQANFTTGVPGSTANALSYPEGLEIDPVSDHLYVADESNHRVVGYNLANTANNLAATIVFGAPAFGANTSGNTAAKLNRPLDVAVDVTGRRLFVADGNNNRIVVYDVRVPTNGAAAVDVFGQATTSANTAFTTATGFSKPADVTFESASGVLVVSEQTNFRTMFFDVPIGASLAAFAVMVDPVLTFAVTGRAAACNGVTPTASTSTTSSAINLGRPTALATSIAAQDLAVTTNAATGYSVYAKSSGPLTAAVGSIPDVGGTNATPTAFPALGTAGFGYTTSDALLGTGNTTRFADPTNKWAAFSNSPSEVAFVGVGPVSNDITCLAYQVGVGSDTKAGSYSTTVTYSAVPLF